MITSGNARRCSSGRGVADRLAVERRRHRRVARDDAVLAAGLLARGERRRIPDLERQRAIVARGRTAFLGVQDVGTIPVGDLNRAHADACVAVRRELRRRRRHDVDVVLLRENDQRDPPEQCERQAGGGERRRTESTGTHRIPSRCRDSNRRPADACRRPGRGNRGTALAPVWRGGGRHLPFTRGDQQAAENHPLFPALWSGIRVGLEFPKAARGCIGGQRDRAARLIVVGDVHGSSVGDLLLSGGVDDLIVERHAAGAERRDSQAELRASRRGRPVPGSYTTRARGWRRRLASRLCRRDDATRCCGTLRSR